MRISMCVQMREGNVERETILRDFNYWLKILELLLLVFINILLLFNDKWF